jgi:hypothetical protein
MTSSKHGLWQTRKSKKKLNFSPKMNYLTKTLIAALSLSSVLGGVIQRTIEDGTGDETSAGIHLAFSYNGKTFYTFLRYCKI